MFQINKRTVQQSSFVVFVGHLAGAALIVLGALQAAVGETGSSIDFNRDIRPILSDKCFNCHGPDEANREAGLRLDERESATGELDTGSTAIVPGDPAGSELVRRITSEDDWERMPPSESVKQLSEDEIAKLQEWIGQGAEYSQHWSFIPPSRPPQPDVEHKEWCKTGIDHFVLQELERQGLDPSPKADRRTLIRRVSFDLTGLPPTIEEVNAFLADREPGAYERLVDRLLASPRFGERLATHWLDLARYADTDGYEKDSHRQMWPYRDWVIDAFNENKPFDEFTIEQLAGDLIPEATMAQKVASAFNRNGPTTSEAGSNPDEYAAKYAVDRVNTTATVWLGLTMQCAECHDHKFDPLTTKDFYRFFAFFNQVPEDPLFEGANSPPSIVVPTEVQQTELADLEKQASRLNERLIELAGAKLPERADIRDGLIADYSFDEPNLDQVNDFSGHGHNGLLRTANVNGNASPERCDGPLHRAMRFRGGGEIECQGDWNFSPSRGISYSAWVRPTFGGGVVLSKIDPHAGSRGFDLFMQEGHAIVHIIDEWPDLAIKMSTTTSYVPDEWMHVLVVWNGMTSNESVQVYFNGEPQPLQNDNLGQTVLDVNNSAPLLIGSRAAGESALVGLIDQVRIYDRALTDGEARSDLYQAVNRINRTAAEQRTAEQAKLLADCYRQTADDDESMELRTKLAEVELRQAELREQIPQVRVMQDAAEMRPTHILVRGDFRTPGDPVTAGVPEALGQVDEGEVNRILLARWLVGSENPLTSRVTVNRLWALCFGQGLVTTLSDFGSQGAWPSHPELLDWLAVEFVESGWDVKGLLKTIVTSSTYQQSSAVSPELLEIDPANRLLARGPRHRLSAEMLRDNVLAISGLLQHELGGPSVFPYHPPGLWEEMAWADSPWKTWIQSEGQDLYRRGLYTFWKRSLVHPAFALFDAPSRNVCEVDRPRTNTPLQAFVTLNEVSHLEAARVLAERMLTEGGQDQSERIGHGYLLALARRPTDAEMSVLVDLARKMGEKYETSPEQALAVIEVGETPAAVDIDPGKLAAWTMVAQAILNLDETLTKE